MPDLVRSEQNLFSVALVPLDLFRLMTRERVAPSYIPFPGVPPRFSLKKVFATPLMAILCLSACTHEEARGLTFLSPGFFRGFIYYQLAISGDPCYQFLFLYDDANITVSRQSGFTGIPSHSCPPYRARHIATSQISNRKSGIRIKPKS
jgi:hypothetical protein